MQIKFIILVVYLSFTFNITYLYTVISGESSVILFTKLIIVCLFFNIQKLNLSMIYFKSIDTTSIINKMNNTMKEKEVYMLNIFYLQKINHYYIRMT